MKLYCMCQLTGPGTFETGGVMDDQQYMAPNRFIRPEDANKKSDVLLDRPMKVIRIGVGQRIPIESDKKFPNLHPRSRIQQEKERIRLRKETRNHFPNVDILHCERCGAIVCLEG